MMSTGLASSFQSGQFKQKHYFSKIETTIKAIKTSAGKVHSLVLTDTGSVYSFGNGQKGQLGYDSDDRYKPKEIVSLKDKNIVDIFCGTHTSFALTAEGKLFGWGCDLFFQLGNGNGINSIDPTPVGGALSEKTVQKVAPGMLHTAAITTDGEVYVWGSNRHFQLADKELRQWYEPLLLNTNKIKSKIIDIVAGWNHNVLLTENGEVYSWGDNSRGQTGTNDGNQARLQRVEIDKKIIKISCSSNSTFLVTEENQIYCFGVGTEHQLGLGEYFSDENHTDLNEAQIIQDQKNYRTNGVVLYSPQLISWKNSFKIIQIEGGDSHTVVLIQQE